MEKMKTLTKEIDGLKAPAKPETAELVAEVPFEHLKDELVELEVLVQALVSTLNGSNSSVVNLYEEVQNISNMVSQLESFDKNKLLQLRREMESLKERLQDCEKSPKQPAEPAEVPYGNCEHSGLAHIGKPTLVQLNWKGSSHKYGGWGKDTAFPPARKNLYWVAPLNMDGRILEAFRTYSSYNDLLLYRSSTEKQLSIYKKSTGRWNHTNGGQGAGMIIHGDYFYYNCYNSADMCRYNLKTGVVERKTLLNAMNNIRFTYSHVTYQYLDFASDEHGLWVMYATEDSAGKIVISKLDVTSFSVVKSWTTTEYKPLVTNAFMICGVMYAVRPLGSNKEEIFYRYDTKTGQEEQMSLVMETLMDTVQSMNYNPNEHRIYIFNDGYQMYYETNFAH
ncbi:olfactomedin-like [Ambystoma mexicanum]|uniref:olfactomedin-like n=1 Tax=Ambystoma mexicanum TaxID=8296 RepID=UPI0037E9B076